MEFNYEIVECVKNSIYKNIGELAEMCLEYNIQDAYDLMDVISRYGLVWEYLEKQNKSGNLRGLHDGILAIMNGEEEDGEEEEIELVVL